MTISSPRDISGLRLWLSADAITGYSDNTQMTTAWTDLSGNGFDGTPTGTTKPLYRTTAGSAGGPAVEFPNSGYFTFGNIMASAAAGEIMATLKHNTGDTGLWAFGADTGNSDESHYPFGSTVYESFGLQSGQRRSFGVGTTIDSWHRYNVWSASNDFTARLDEVVQDSINSTTVSWTSTPTIGAGRKTSIVDLKFSGWIGCVVVYNRKLTTTERSDLVTWMTAHPSGGTIPGAHPLVASWTINPQYTARLSAPHQLSAAWTVELDFTANLRASLGTWHRDESQKYRIEYVYGADLTTGIAATPPPAAYATSGVGKRVSPVFPAPTLDSRGRPT